MKNYQSVLVTAVLALSSVSTTHASTVRIEGNLSNGDNTVFYVGDDPVNGGTTGVNNVTVSYESFELTGKFPDGYYVEDKAGITAGAGCKQQSRTLAICGIGGMPKKVKADLKGGNDIFTPVPYTFSDLSFGLDPIMEVNGGAGDDTLNGNQRNDVLSGGAGKDIINGQLGDDTLLGGDGNDTINGNSGKDTINGQAGDDILNGNENDDVIFGGSGKDNIWGGAGKDKISAESGDDFINSDDKEADNLSCGIGLDRVKIGKDALIDVINRDCEDLF